MTFRELLEDVTYESYLESLEFKLHEKNNSIQILASTFSKQVSLPLEKVIKVMKDKAIFKLLKLYNFSIDNIVKIVKEGAVIAKKLLKAFLGKTNATADWIEAHPVLSGLAFKVLIGIILYFVLTGIIIPNILGVLSAGAEGAKEVISSQIIEVGNTGAKVLSPTIIPTLIGSAIFALKGL